ncbi:MAG: GNAT family N-acetyltransferase [Rhizomicrobium sp.]
MSPRLLAADADLEPLAAIHASCFPDAWSVQDLRDLLAMPGTFMLAVDDGFILARIAADEAEILTLAVSPEARRNGTGRALVATAATHAQQLGAGVMFLEVGVANEAARALYADLGFMETGRRKAYYSAGRAEPEDALVLRSNLPISPLGKRCGSG